MAKGTLEPVPQESTAPDDLTRHRTYYIADMVEIQVDQVLFRVPKYALESSTFFRGWFRAAGSNSRTVSLDHESITSAEFEMLLRLLYPITPGEYQLASIQEWTTARKVAAALGFDRARTLAEQKIHDLQVARAILASSEPRVQADVLSIENIQHPISGMQANMIVVKDISLAPPHVPGSIPQVAVGLSTLNVDCSAHARVRTEVSVTNESSFRVAISSWADSTVYAAGVNWLAVPQATGIQTGCAELFLPIHSGRLRDKSSDPVQLAHIRFTRAYSGPPKIVCWLTGLDIDPANTYRLRTWATDVTPGGFTLCAQTWMHSLLHGVGACWLAIPQDAPGVFVGEYRATMDVRSGYVEFPLGMFNVTPKAVVGLTKIDFRSKINLRARAVVKNVTTEGFTWEVQTWDDSHMYAAEITVVVVETAA